VESLIVNNGGGGRKAQGCAMVGQSCNGRKRFDLERKSCYHYYNLSEVRRAVVIRQLTERQNELG